TGTQFVARTPQVRYTYPLGPGWTIAVAGENPNPNVIGPFGSYFTDTNQIPNMASCSAINAVAPTATSATTGVTTIGGTGGAGTLSTNITNACLGNAAFFNPLQQYMPTFVVRSRVDQPWGHLQVGAAMLGIKLNDGRFLNRSFIGYGGGI